MAAFSSPTHVPTGSREDPELPYPLIFALHPQYVEALCPAPDGPDPRLELLPLRGTSAHREQAEAIRSTCWSAIVQGLARAEAFGRTSERALWQARARAMLACNRHTDAAWWIAHADQLVAHEERAEQVPCPSSASSSSRSALFYPIHTMDTSDLVPDFVPDAAPELPHDPAALRAGIPETREERDAYLFRIVAQGAEALADEVAQGRSESLLSYLEFAAKFYRYSIHNQTLIRAQYPEASFVAAYSRWLELGYQVRKGERGIRIWAPRPYKDVNAETGEVEREGVYFIPVAVFDVAQVEPLDGREHVPIPAFFRPLGEEGALLADKLTTMIQRAGIRVRADARLGATQGVSARGVITLNAGLDGTNRFLTLTHEYAHELLHQNAERRGDERAIKECEAEAVSYIVARHFGVHNPFSADYLQEWGNTATELMAQLDGIQRAASHIIEGLEYQLRAPRTEHASHPAAPEA